MNFGVDKGLKNILFPQETGRIPGKKSLMPLTTRDRAKDGT
jgi:hypothetical protein